MKFLRDLWRLKTQYAAIAMVLACGVAMTVMAFSALNALSEAREAYYAETRFADVFVNLRRAPMRAARPLAAIDGVATVDVRIEEAGLVDIPGRARPATGRLVSLTDGDSLNRVLLTEGRRPDPDRPTEAIALESFLEANDMRLGTTLNVLVRGRLLPLRIVGAGRSPEYVLAAEPGSLVPDPSAYAVFWVDEKALAAASDLEDSFNSAALTLTAAADPPAVQAAVKRELAPYGVTDAILRADQPSHAYLEAEFEQLFTIGLVLPPIFLLVAGFLVQSVLARQFETERTQIGLMKAFGFTNAEVGAHYARHAAATGTLGLVSGVFFGLWLASAIMGLYAEFYRLPDVAFALSWPAIGGATLAVAIAVAIGVWRPLARVVAIPPAVAMSPPAPAVYRRGLLDRLGLATVLDALSQIVLRTLERWPARAAMTAFGLALALASLVATVFFFDSIDRMVARAFFEANRWQMSVTLAEPQPLRALAPITALPGVIAAEGTRTVAAEISAGAKSKRIGLIGLPQEAVLTVPLDPSGEPMGLPANGVIISTGLAKRLGVEPGERVRLSVLERSRPQVTLRVGALSEELTGLTAFIGLEELSRLMGEPPLVSTLNLLVAEDRRDGLYALLKRTPLVVGVEDRDQAVTAFTEELAEGIFVTMFFYVGFAAAIAFGVAYNTARIALSERSRDLASLRVLGFTTGETAYVLLAELGLLTLAALPVGAILGYWGAAYFSSAFSTEFYSVPLVVSSQTYGISVAVVVVTVALSALVVAWRIRRLDLVGVLKTRE
ncbi:ABC transporter permease [Afifella pfennigii]|uniref:ABC transporter permease n=1 Tax=Afifella pfennigii TaxID=209897 RepID=UPI00146FA69A|nr:FtsX-like permease family protein [Afifella pfennigii]